MARRLRTLNDPTKMDLTPMIDVTFLILVFFMCTFQFKTFEGTLGAHLPKDVGVGGHGLPIDDFRLALRVVEPGVRHERAAKEGGGHEFVGRVLEYTGGRVLRSSQLSDVSGHAKRLVEILGDDLRVRIDPGEGVVQNDVVEVLDVLIEAGATNISFEPSTEHSREN